MQHQQHGLTCGTGSQRPNAILQGAPANLSRQQGRLPGVAVSARFGGGAPTAGRGGGREGGRGRGDGKPIIDRRPKEVDARGGWAL
eukprot:720428-Pelagomonas_calceolata.AAC.1